MKLISATSALVASTLLTTTVGALPLKPKSVVEESNISASRSLEVVYTLVDEVDPGTGDNTCQSKRFSKISDTMRLISMDCDSNFSQVSRINVYDFNKDTLEYSSVPVFTTSDIHPRSNSAFSPDGKTIVTVNTSGCGGKIYNEDSNGIWSYTNISFFPCDGTVPKNFLGQFEIGINEDGAMFAIGSGDGAVFAFEKQSDDSWLTVYNYIDSGRLDNSQNPYTTCFVNLSRDGKKLLYTDFRPNRGPMILKYVERNDNGTWTTPIEVPTIATGGYDARGYFTPDGSRLVVSTTDSGIKVFDYDNAGSWTLVKTFTDNKFNGSDGNYMADISDNGKRIIYCGINMGNDAVVTFDEQIDGTWTQSYFGNQKSMGGCTIDGSGGLMVVSTANDGVLNAYRDLNIDLAPTAGGGGDPHFIGFGGIYFTWQGHCDLVLVKSTKHIDMDTHFEVHIRTTRIRKWSKIDSIAIKVGEYVGEISSDNGKFIFDDHEVSEVQNESLIVVKSVKKLFSKSGKAIYLYDITFLRDKKLEIEVNTRTGMIYTKLSGNYPQNTEGILGSPHQSGLVTRNGDYMTSSNVNAFAESWQLRDNDSHLFKTDRAPQYPSPCTYNSKKMVASQHTRHLKELHTVPAIDAITACAIHRPGPLKDFCVNDVLMTGDLDSAKDDFYE